MMKINQSKAQIARKRILLKRRVVALTAGVLVPLTAYSLTLTDYINVATVSSSVDQFEQITTNNTGQVEVTPNAELTIVKIVENDNGGSATADDFSVYTDAVVADADVTALTFGPGTTIGTTTTYTSNKLYVPPGTFSLEEANVVGYGEGSWSCDVGIVNDTSFDAGEVVLAFGEQATCTIINDDIAPTLTLTKIVNNDAGGALGPTDFSLYRDGGLATSGAAVAVAANADIEIREDIVAGYTAGTWECADANAADTGWTPITGGLATGTTVNLLPGSEVVCTITNEDKGVDLSIVKSVDDNTPDIGQEITFTMAVSNAGPDEATGVTVTDIVPDGFTYAGSITGGDSSDDNNPTTTGLSWTINSIPAGTGPVLLTFTATVNAP